MSAVPHLPPPVFQGFIAKKFQPVAPLEWVGVAEICSVSPCIAHYPDRWDDDPFASPAFNRAYCLATAEDAWARVPEAERASSRVYALTAVPAVFTKDSPTPVLLAADELYSPHDGFPALPEEPDLSAYERLGFDVTVFGSMEERQWGWSCSPLSCNYMFQEHRVNRYCLIDDLADAVAAAHAFARDEPEEGPYVIVEVFREAK